MKPKILSLDIGCGFSNRYHKRCGHIGIDLHKGFCDIQCDAHFLPFKDAIFNTVLLYHVLEHLDHPLQAIKESIRVSKKNAKFEIIIPIEKKFWINDLKSIIFEFPLGFFMLLGRIRKIHQLRPMRGTLHKNLITPDDIVKYLTITKYEIEPRRHMWNIFLRKIFGRDFEYGKVNYIIEASKKTAESCAHARARYGQGTVLGILA